MTCNYAASNLSKCRTDLLKKISSIVMQHENKPPEILVVAPGRVNLIGEHIDHQGYSVLPVTISQGIVLASVWNPKKFPCQDFLRIITYRDSCRVDEEKITNLAYFGLRKDPCWVDYVSCGFWGAILLSHQPNQRPTPKLIRGARVTIPTWLQIAEQLFNSKDSFYLTIYITSNLPIAAGLSSSSALIVGSMIIFLRVFGITASRTEVAVTAATVETWLGASGGGMDQAAICLSQHSMAQKISFNPLRTESVPLPSNLAVVLCDSGQKSFKVSTANIYYNKRIFELTFGCFLMLYNAGDWSDEDEASLSTLTLKAVQTKLNFDLANMLERLEKTVSHLPYSKDDILNVMGESRLKKILQERVGQGVWFSNVFFEPYRRLIHVLTESQRVEQLVQLCRESFSVFPDIKAIKKLGDLMNASDRSLTLFYDNKTIQLEIITSAARSLGAYGSRVVGAGWGGCVLSLVLKEEAQEFVKKLKIRLAQEFNSIRDYDSDQYSPTVFWAELDDGVTVLNATLNVIEWT